MLFAIYINIGRDGSEREEGARSWEPRGMGAVATSAAAVRRFLWTHSPADADGKSRRVAVWGAGPSFGPEKPLAWSGLVLPPPLLLRNGEVQRPCFRPGVVSPEDPPQWFF